MPAGTDPPEFDPFEGLVLDESFINNAKAKEAAAHERSAKASRIARGHEQITPPGDPIAPPRAEPPGRRGRWRRSDPAGSPGSGGRTGSTGGRGASSGSSRGADRAADRWENRKANGGTLSSGDRFGSSSARTSTRPPWIWLIVAVVVVLLVFVFLGGHHSGGGTKAPSSTTGGGATVTTAGPEATAATSILSVTNPQVGDCLSTPNAGSAAGSNPVSVVACSSAHGQQIVALENFSADPATYPTGATAATLATTLCRGAVLNFGNATTLPTDLAVVLNLPAPAQWTAGSRKGWCAVVPAGAADATRVGTLEDDGFGS